MVKGLYTAYTGMINEQHRMDVLTNNLANANTNGYKKEGATAQSFSDQLALKIKDYTDAPFTARGLGIINPGVKIGEGYVDWTEGPMRETGNTFDMAIGGYGFFGIEYAIKLPEETEEAGEGGTITETYMEKYLRLQRQKRELAAYQAGKLSLDEMLDDGFQQEIMYTRDGNFTLTSEGVLVTQDGDFVLNAEGGHIQLDPNLPVQISMTGEIMQDGEVVANIGVFDFEKQIYPDGRYSYDTLEHYGENAYRATADAVAINGTGSVYAGFLEQSNVSVVDEMVQMIAVQRNYDTNQKMITTIDDTLDLAVNQVGRLS
ncbi:flagellar hook-basal body protein [Butyrivibrio sp. CB08]|uniref:flagellar hook-basal body protein n=1 Tax=Butyrivibrio sp. CB08 TaxID=2364879 RepID=UPI000EAA14C2|nr:flagellar hook-basal body protein [Butyrivibrio sp. CB08]RKM59857.1 flagellar hook-basal body protein [Butyrivibrio sp. CB08]